MSFEFKFFAVIIAATLISIVFFPIGAVAWLVVFLYVGAHNKPNNKD